MEISTSRDFLKDTGFNVVDLLIHIHKELTHCGFECLRYSLRSNLSHFLELSFIACKLLIKQFLEVASNVRGKSQLFHSCVHVIKVCVSVDTLITNKYASLLIKSHIKVSMYLTILLLHAHLWTSLVTPRLGFSFLQNVTCVELILLHLIKFD